MLYLSSLSSQVAHCHRFLQPAINFSKDIIQWMAAFKHGNAKSLQFPDNSFDIVMNVEASLYYPHIERFFRDVVRVLKPNGYFVYADIRYAEELEAWQSQLKNTGLELLKEENIAPNVIRALELEKERRINLIQRYAPRVLHGILTNFAGIDGANLVPKSS